MRDFLIDGLPQTLYHSFYNECGRDNVDYLLSSLELICYVLEDPSKSTFWLEFANARHDGIHSSVFKFPSLIDKYFPMSFIDFLSYPCDVNVFTEFEDECLRSCAKLDIDQVYRARDEALYVYDLTKDRTAF